MGRTAYPSSSLPAVVRQHFGLTQTELARFLNVSREHLSNAEAGRKDLGEAALHRLWVLAHHLPPPDGQGAAAPEFLPTDAADYPEPPHLSADPVRERLQRCQLLLTKARFVLAQQEAQQVQFARRSWALAQLREALAAPPGTPAHPFMSPNPPADLHWLNGLIQETAATPPPLSTAERTMQLARQRGLEAEIATLEAGIVGAAT